MSDAKQILVCPSDRASHHEFIAMISHQLRTPIGAVRSGLSLLHENPVNRVITEPLLEKTDNLSGLIDDLLSLLEIDEEKIVRDEKFPIAKVVSEALKQVAEKAVRRGVKLNWLENCCEASIVGDRRSIDMAVLHLLDNATSYTMRGGTVEISTTCPTENLIRVNVTDTGIGIPEKEQSRMFSKFFRASNASLGKNEGSGVGLFLVRHIATAHGGTAGFSSKEDKGSTFWIELPTSK